MTKSSAWASCLCLIVVFLAMPARSQPTPFRSIYGVVVTDKNEPVAGATVVAEYNSCRKEMVTDSNGTFRLVVPSEAVTLNVVGKYLVFEGKRLDASESAADLRLQVSYTLPSVHEGTVISSSVLNPAIGQRNDNVYKSTLFSRDDQIFDTLAAGINAGQHEGGGKSLEIRRFGFNLDHGGVNGGLKVMVNDVQQNQATQGHGQGYLGTLRTLTPELVDDVDILNGPFSAEYGDFSVLGVVHIRLKESLPNLLTVRVQGGSFELLGRAP